MATTAVRDPQNEQLIMSLLCAYSDSSASSGSEDEGEQQIHVNTAVSSAPALPSVDDLFSSSSSGASVLSSSAGSRYTAASSAGDANKRRAQSEIRVQDNKRPKAVETAKPQPKAQKPAKQFAPPQLKRPNVSTEDLGAWNTQKTMQHHGRKPKGEA